MIERIAGGDMAARTLIEEGIVRPRFAQSEDTGLMAMRALQSPTTGLESLPPHTWAHSALKP
jgi:hypothetical protein